ncbi:BQ5605_C002g01779 [Microbotryum silenes-dioicae]|uniref:BQ5605_C002g01779 protein n=1 Tax=Microbotryum silenes-dioicae TaxID=796604 RepID=A0A2X0P2M9_9BASI|nr:BQ5605_C002g01779 [Microbotryum silenes-dioicae]
MSEEMDMFYVDESYSFSSWRVSPRLRRCLVGEETERKEEGRNSTKSEQGREGPLVQRWMKSNKEGRKEIV